MWEHKDYIINDLPIVHEMIFNYSCSTCSLVKNAKKNLRVDGGPTRSRHNQAGTERLNCNAVTLSSPSLPPFPRPLRLCRRHATLLAKMGNIFVKKSKVTDVDMAIILTRKSQDSRRSAARLPSSRGKNSMDPRSTISPVRPLVDVRHMAI